MDFQELISRLPARKGAVLTLENGKPMRRAYSQLYQDFLIARDNLRHWGVARGHRVGIHAPNSIYWLVYDLALIDIGAISVAFTDDFEGKIDDALLAHHGVNLLLVSGTSARWRSQRPDHVAFIDAETPHAKIIDRQRQTAGDEDDQLSLVFSSGSSGGLKGLVISRKGAAETLPPIMDALGVHPGDSMLLFLPMSNFQQRFLCYGALWYDFDVIITDFTRLYAAMKQLRPTILLAPPVFYNMLHAEYARRPAWQRLAHAALATMLPALGTTRRRQAVARRLFGDFYGQFGGDIRMLITGMAPIKRSVTEFFAAMQLPLCEAYGMVEAGVMTYRPAGCRNHGSVGKPLRGVRFSVAEDGELIVSRDHPLTLRYFQCSEGENERTFVGAGRIATGDIGIFAEDGAIRILGRKGEVIVTPSGHKVHPEVIEHELNNCDDVENSVVFQKSGAPHLSCVVSLAKPPSDDVKRRVKKFVSAMQTTRKASQFVEVIFSDSPFSRENGMLRPNMKIDRRRVAAQYCKT